MANQLDEMSNENILEEGRDTNVVAKKIPVTVGIESTLITIGIWALPIIIGGAIGFALKAQYGIIAIIIGLVVGFIPGVVFSIMKVNAGNYLLQLEQKIQHDLSQIDNYQEQRVIILENAAKLLDKGIELDKDTFTKIAQLRSGNLTDEQRNEKATTIDALSRNIQVAFENYPDLKAHAEIEDCLQQNSYLQKEITAAREIYNDAVLAWNREIFEWPVKKIVAAKNGYTTRIPFIASKDIKDKSKGVFF